MRNSILAALGTVAAMLAASPAATEPAAATYLLSMKMHDGDRLVGSPVLTIAAGTPSKVAISDAAGNRYEMSVTATAQGTETVALASTIDVVSAGVQRTASPNLLVAFDTPSAIAFGNHSATSKPFRVDFTIKKLS